MDNTIQIKADIFDLLAQMELLQRELQRLDKLKTEKLKELASLSQSKDKESV
jgi:hypothetical protein